MDTDNQSYESCLQNYHKLKKHKKVDVDSYFNDEMSLL